MPSSHAPTLVHDDPEQPVVRRGLVVRGTLDPHHPFAQIEIQREYNGRADLGQHAGSRVPEPLDMEDQHRRRLVHRQLLLGVRQHEPRLSSALRGLTAGAGSRRLLAQPPERPVQRRLRLSGRRIRGSRGGGERGALIGSPSRRPRLLRARRAGVLVALHQLVDAAELPEAGGDRRGGERRRGGPQDHGGQRAGPRDGLGAEHPRGSGEREEAALERDGRGVVDGLQQLLVDEDELLQVQELEGVAAHLERADVDGVQVQRQLGGVAVQRGALQVEHPQEVAAEEGGAELRALQRAARAEAGLVRVLAVAAGAAPHGVDRLRVAHQAPLQHEAPEQPVHGRLRALQLGRPLRGGAAVVCSHFGRGGVFIGGDDRLFCGGDDRLFGR